MINDKNTTDNISSLYNRYKKAITNKHTSNSPKKLQETVYDDVDDSELCMFTNERMLRLSQSTEKARFMSPKENKKQAPSGKKLRFSNMDEPLVENVDKLNRIFKGTTLQSILQSSICSNKRSKSPGAHCYQDNLSDDDEEILHNLTLKSAKKLNESQKFRSPDKRSINRSFENFLSSAKKSINLSFANIGTIDFEEDVDRSGADLKNTLSSFQLDSRIAKGVKEGKETRYISSNRPSLMTTLNSTKMNDKQILKCTKELLSTEEFCKEKRKTVLDLCKLKNEKMPKPENDDSAFYMTFSLNELELESDPEIKPSKNLSQSGSRKERKRSSIGSKLGSVEGKHVMISTIATLTIEAASCRNAQRSSSSTLVRASRALSKSSQGRSLIDVNCEGAGVFNRLLKDLERTKGVSEREKKTRCNKKLGQSMRSGSKKSVGRASMSRSKKPSQTLSPVISSRTTKTKCSCLKDLLSIRTNLRNKFRDHYVKKLKASESLLLEKEDLLNQKYKEKVKILKRKSLLKEGKISKDSINFKNHSTTSKKIDTDYVKIIKELENELIQYKTKYGDIRAKPTKGTEIIQYKYQKENSEIRKQLSSLKQENNMLQEKINSLTLSTTQSSLSHTTETRPRIFDSENTTSPSKYRRKSEKSMNGIEGNSYKSLSNNSFKRIDNIMMR